MALLGTPAASELQRYLAKNGRFPPVTLQVLPIDGSRQPVEFNRFSSYSFVTSVIVPVDSFQFTMRNPTLEGSLLNFVRDGDIAVLKANGQVVCTGIVDTVNVKTGPDVGEEVVVQGRNLLSQLEDQSTVNDVDDPIWGNRMGFDAVINALIMNTRINFYRTQQAPTLPSLPLFATEPGESKLSALMRYLEPLNCLVWSDADGTAVLGRPDMGGDVLGSFMMDRENRAANCLSIQANYSSTRIPNIVLPIWTGQETVQSRVTKEQAVPNNAKGPKRLLSQGHRVTKCVVVSNPQGSDPQALSQTNQLVLSGGSNVLQAYAKRELARANVGELGVQVNIKGHYNSDLDPIMPDTNYQIVYPRASVNEDMYLHTVEYGMEEKEGQRTSLFFCKKGAIVADVSVQSKKSASTKSLASGAT
jgi:prophage tail gpP-like protein